MSFYEPTVDEAIFAFSKVDEALALICMLQDFERGRKTEVDFINGYVATVGRAYGVPVPLNAAIAGLIHQIEQGVFRPSRDRMNELAAQMAA